MKIPVFLLLGILCASAKEMKKDYSRHKVYTVQPQTEEMKNHLNKMKTLMELDFWNEIGINQPINVRVRPEFDDKFVEHLSNIGLKPGILIDDLQKKIDTEVIGNYSRDGMTWTAHYTLEDIYAWFDDLAEAHPDKVSIIKGGSTYEKRTIKGLKISFKPGNKAVFIEGGIHAREWVSPATVTYIANELLTSTDPAFKKIAQSFDWTVFGEKQENRIHLAMAVTPIGIGIVIGWGSTIVMSASDYRTGSTFHHRMKIPVFLLLGIIFASAREMKKDYSRHKVYTVQPQTEEMKNHLNKMKTLMELDFWNEIGINQPINVRVLPEFDDKFVEHLSNIGLKPDILIDDLQKKIDTELIGNYSRDGMTWTAHYTLEDIYAWFDDLAEAHPDKVSIIKGGSTYEKRTIKGLKISFKPGNKAVFIEGGIHAREWVSPATVTYIANELLTSTDPAFKKIAQSFDWYIFPVLNLDGFVYSHTTDRFWRKTRKPYRSCYGADPNRNWDCHWMETGASNDPCSDTYGGPKPFSEVCTSTLSKFIRTIAPSLVAYIDFHTHAKMLMVPYGHTTAHLENYNDTYAIGKKAIEALAKRYGTKYQLGNIAETIYPASGGSIDWVKMEFHTPLVYVYELRGDSFVLPMDELLPNCLEIVDSLIAMFEEAEKLGYVHLD